MAHIIEEAKSGRSKCRGCNDPISKGELRFGERMENPFADDSEMTLWFHLKCGALRRSESFSEVLDHQAVRELSELNEFVEAGIEHPRLERIVGAEHAPSGRAKCRHCHEMIAKGEWRIPLTFFEEGMFNSSGYVHVGCAADFFGTTDLMARLIHFAPDLPASDIDEINAVIQSGPA